MAQFKDMGRAARMRQRAVLEFINEQESATRWEVANHFPRTIDSGGHNALYYAALLDLEDLGFIARHNTVFMVTMAAFDLLEAAANKA